MTGRSRGRFGVTVASAAGVLLTYACGSTEQGSTPAVNPGTGDDAGSDAPDSPIGQADTGPGRPDGSADASEAGDARTPEGGSDVGLTADAPSPVPEGGVLCNVQETWGAPTSVLTTAAADQTVFGAVTPDELTVAWASSTGGVVTAWYADRASVSDSFGTPQALASTFGSLSLDRVSLSGDGLRIVGVSAAGTSFVAAKRSARPGTFDTDDHAEFAGLAPEGVTNTYATPLLSSNDDTFLYLVVSSTSDHVVYQSAGGPPWSPGAYLSPTQLERVGTQYRRPSGLSADALTLFYWDETSGSEFIAFRQSPSQDFSVFASIGPLTNAVPVTSCSRIYYSVPANGGPAGAITIVYADGTAPDD